MNLSRRSALRGLTYAGAASCLGASSVQAETMKLSRDVPAVYPFRVGQLEGWVISDGTFTVKPPYPSLAPNATQSGVDALLSANLQPTTHVTLYLNVVLLKIGHELVLFDTGVGGYAAPEQGWLQSNLRKIGVSPEEITAVLLSHGHSDHFGGLLNAEYKPAFPKAKIFANPAELDFWCAAQPDLSKGYGTPEFKAAQISRGHSTLPWVQKAFEPMKPGSKLFGCIDVLHLPGHTPGHVGYRITSGDQTLIHTVDLAHSHVLMIQSPNWMTAFDVWPDEAVTTRRKALQQLADGKIRMMGYHLPFPGIGLVGPDGSGFRWYPEEWSWG